MNRSSTLELLAKLRSLNVMLSADIDQLRRSVPALVMTSDLHNELTAGRVELLSFLNGTSLASQLQPPAIALNASRAMEMPWGPAHCLR